MDAQKTTDQKPTRQDLLDAWAAYEAARNAAVAGGRTYDLGQATAAAYIAYEKLNRKIVGKGVQP